MRSKIVLIIACISVIGVIVLSVLLWKVQSSVPKTAYVNISKLYNDFQMKKELEGQLQNVHQMRKTQLDSMEIKLKVMSSQLDAMSKPDKKEVDLFMAKREEYLLMKQQFDQDNNAMSQQYSEQIMKQLSQYVEDYGKENEYTYILGAEGSGAIMHADASQDITDLVLVYVNNRYQGGKGK